MIFSIFLMTTECLSGIKLYFDWQHDTEHSIRIILYVEHFRSVNHWLDHFRLIKLAVTSIGRRFRTHMICQNYKVSFINFESTHLKLQPPWGLDLVGKGSSKKREVGNFSVGKSEMKSENSNQSWIVFHTYIQHITYFIENFGRNFSISEFPTKNFPTSGFLQIAFVCVSNLQ